MHYDFQENEQAGQEKIQRLTAEADEWRRTRALLNQTTKTSKALRQLRLAWVTVINLLLGR